MKKLFPGTLKQGDKIALVSPAGFLTDEKFEKSVNNIKKLGFEPYFENSLREKHGYLAGEAKSRANEINKMFQNRNVKAILCARGGYGTSSLGNYLNYKLIRENPKPFIGYSDITYLNHALYKHSGLISFHGIAGVSDFTDYTVSCFNELLINEKDTKVIKSFDYSKKSQSSEFEKFIIKKGKAEGRLTGGNLSLLCSLIGTEDLVSFKNKIVFIEEINEPPYKIDRMLTHLISATDISDAAAIVYGIFNKCEYYNFDINKENTLTIKEILTEKSKNLKMPAVYGFSFGHIDNQAIFPFGQKAVFSAESFELYI